MYLQPNYMENIIVGIIFNSQFSWYVTDKELWFLDYSKMIVFFEKKGIKVNIDYIDNRRKNTIILDTENVSEFLTLIATNKVTANELNYNLLANITEIDDTWKFNYRPSLYINFDKKILYSNYSEPASYEDYVPNLWEAKYEPFDDFIPNDQKYWLDFYDKNLLY